MSNRVNTIDRRGVNAFEGFVLNKLGWIFRGQDVCDIGIDAHIEQVINGDSTGKQIAVQIKTGLGNVSRNKSGDFDYYISLAHYNYWLSFSIPVIIVLYDPDADALYWNSIFKRNVSKTKSDKPKITIKKESVCTKESVSDFEEIIALYQAKSFLNDDLCKMDKEELSEYGCELLSRCSESLSQMRRHIDTLDLDYKKGVNQMECFIAENKQGYSKEQAEKEIKKVAKNYSLALNVCRTRMSAEIPLLVDVFVGAFQYADQYLLPEIGSPELSEVKQLLENELSELKRSIDSLMGVLDKVYAKYGNSEAQTTGLKHSEILFSKIIQDYQYELKDLSELTGKFIEKINTTDCSR